MKLLLIEDDNYNYLKNQNPNNNLFVLSNMCVDINNKKINIIRDIDTNFGEQSIQDLMSILTTKLVIGAGGYIVSKEPNAPEYMGYTKSFNKECNTEKKMNIEDPTLSKEYGRNHIWVIVYEDSDKNVHLATNNIFMTESDAKLECMLLIAEKNDEITSCEELTVIGVPFKNLFYGDTYKVEEEDVKEELVDVLVDIPDEQLLKLAKAAHEQNITLNQLFNNILKDFVDGKVVYDHGKFVYNDDRIGG